jgi:hypothetical protein
MSKWDGNLKVSDFPKEVNLIKKEQMLKAQKEYGSLSLFKSDGIMNG